MKVEKFFYKNNVDICSPKQLYNFITQHFQYYTMNSWNGIKSIANKVKITDLKLSTQLPADYDTVNAVFEIVFNEYDEYGFWDDVNEIIRQFEREHQGFTIYSNGRTGGYLVLAKEHSVIPAVSQSIMDTEDYEDFKYESARDWGGVKNRINQLRFYGLLVRDFDSTCDLIRQVLIEYTKKYGAAIARKLKKKEK